MQPMIDKNKDRMAEAACTGICCLSVDQLISCHSMKKDGVVR